VGEIDRPTSANWAHHEPERSHRTARSSPVGAVLSLVAAVVRLIRTRPRVTRPASAKKDRRATPRRIGRFGETMRGFAPNTCVAARTASGQYASGRPMSKAGTPSAETWSEASFIPTPKFSCCGASPLLTRNERVELKAGREPAAVGEKSVAVEDSRSEFDQLGSSCVAARAPA
jgi:hypothetical protein